MIGDDGSVFSDAEISASLEMNRRDYTNLPLGPVDAGYTWGTRERYWDDGLVFRNNAGVSLTPVISDNLAGRWRFASPQHQVYLTGSRYDVYATAAELLSIWASQVALEFDYSADGASLYRSQKAKALREQAEQYRRMADILPYKMERSDV